MNAQEDIIFLYKIIDGDKKLSNLKLDIEANVYNAETAAKAISVYDKAFFADLISSINFKIELAKMLIEICKKFNMRSNIWELISNKNSVIIEQINILNNKQRILNRRGL